MAPFVSLGPLPYWAMVIVADNRWGGHSACPPVPGLPPRLPAGRLEARSAEYTMLRGSPCPAGTRYAVLHHEPPDQTVSRRRPRSLAQAASRSSGHSCGSGAGPDRGSYFVPCARTWNMTRSFDTLWRSPGGRRNGLERKRSRPAAVRLRRVFISGASVALRKHSEREHEAARRGGNMTYVRSRDARARPRGLSRGLAVVAHPDDPRVWLRRSNSPVDGTGKADHLCPRGTRGEAGIDGMEPEQAAIERAEEERESARAVGVTEVEFLDHRDGEIEYGLPLRRDIARAVRRHRPEVLISLNPHLTWGGSAWNTPDHRAVGTAVVDGARDAANRWIFRELLNGGPRAMERRPDGALQRLSAFNPCRGRDRYHRYGHCVAEMPQSLYRRARR